MSTPSTPPTEPDTWVRARARAAARTTLLRSAPRLTRAIAVRWGETFPFWYVSEYPRSGGTWLGRILATYLDLPFPQQNMAPLALPCVIHNHWKYDQRLRRVLYLYRDGRDVMVSLYILRMQLIANGLGTNHFADQMHRRYSKSLGSGYLQAEPIEHLAKFIEMEMIRPRQAPQNWPGHVHDWVRHSNGAQLSYESLLEDPLATLRKSLLKYVPTVDEEKLADSIRRNDFKRVTGRQPGQEDRTDLFARKGVAGDWRNHFTREAAQIFDQHAGKVLVSLGYEPDRAWIGKCLQ